MIVNAFIIKWKKWKNVGKSYLAIPVVWTTGLMINRFFSGVVSYSMQNGLQ